ncbi:MAG: nitrilase-related carbon-nitrogen hydrolase [Planctomycetota bacterium]
MSERRRSTDPARSCVVAALPMDVVRGEPGRNLEVALAGVRRAAAEGATLVVLPEMWVTSFPASADDDRAADLAATERAWDAVGALARESGVHVAGSAYARGEGERPRNRFRLVGPGGTLLEHDKVHLFTPTAEHLAFAAGDERPCAVDAPVAEDGGAVRVAPTVCYDLRFGALLEPLRADGVELLVVVAQWPRTRASHFRALVVGRAVELQCFVAACNRSGSERIGRRGAPLEFAGNAIVATPDGAVLAEGDGSGAPVLARLDLGRVAAIRREVPVERDARAGRSGPGESPFPARGIR